MDIRDPLKPFPLVPPGMTLEQALADPQRQDQIAMGQRFMQQAGPPPSLLTSLGVPDKLNDALARSNIANVGPGMAKAAWDMFSFPHDAAYGQVDLNSPEAAGRALNFAGGLTLGAGAMPAAEGELGMGIRAYHGSPHDLPMDEASRMGRAREMGFNTDQPVYHGAADDITAFDLGKGGATSGSGVGRMGVSVALEPEVADEFARIAAQKSGGNAQTYPLLARKSKAAAVRLQGDEKNHEIAATLADAWGNGYDAVLFRNYTTPGGKTGKNVLILRDPAQLRSPAAAFDPSRRDDPNILAGIAGLTAGSGAALATKAGLVTPPQDAAPAPQKWPAILGVRG